MRLFQPSCVLLTALCLMTLLAGCAAPASTVLTATQAVPLDREVIVPVPRELTEPIPVPQLIPAPDDSQKSTGRPSVR